MKRKYSFIAVLLCCSLLFTGCSFSIKLGGKSKQNVESNTTDSNSNIESNNNTSSDSNSNSNTTNTSNSNTDTNVTNNSSIKNLKCSKDYSSSMTNNIKMTQDVDIDFKNDEIEKMVMDMNFELPTALSSQASTYFNSLKNQYDSSYGKYNGVTVTVNKISDMKFTIRISLDYKNITAADKTAMSISGSESYALNKTAFEKEGYICK